MEESKIKIYASYASVRKKWWYDYSAQEYDFFMKIFKINYKRFLPSDKTTQIFDIGCGVGFFLYFLEQEGYQNYTGIDISDEQIQQAKKVCKGRLLQYDLFDFLNENTELYDFVIMRHVLEHFKKDEIFNVLKRVNSIMSKEGVLLIEVPNAGSPIFGSYFRYSDFTHEIGFTLESLEDILLANEFNIIYSGPVEVKNPFKRFTFRLLNKILKKILYKNYGLILDASIFAIGQKR